MANIQPNDLAPNQLDDVSAHIVVKESGLGALKSLWSGRMVVLAEDSVYFVMLQLKLRTSITNVHTDRRTEGQLSIRSS
jgi:hypothetical protein